MNSLRIFVLITALIALSNASTRFLHEVWGYKYKSEILPSKWYMFQPKCLGKHQSPININFGETLFDKRLKPIQIVKHSNETNEIWHIVNNGHSVLMTPTNVHFTFTLYPENQTFNMLTMHFHWRGSEHYLDNKKHSGEIHLLFQDQQNKAQYSVIAFLIDLVNNENHSMRPIINEIEKITDFLAEVNSTNIMLENIVPLKIKRYYRYSGSMTTPDCDESVEWNLADKPVIGLSEDQMISFQTLLDPEGLSILTNSRPIQPINDREITRSFYQFRSSRIRSM